ncbi:hypothetical protein [Flavobacterium pedocola]
MKKFLIKIAAYALVLFVLLNGVACLNLYFLGKSNFYKPQFVKNGVKETHFDYVVLGSSTGLTTLNTIAIDSALHTQGLNISMDDSSLNSHYLMLEHFYNCGKTTDKLVLSITPWDVSSTEAKLNNNDYRFASELSKDYVHEYYAEMEEGNFKVLTYSKYIPILAISYYNTELFFPSFLSAMNPKKQNRSDAKGNYSYPDFNGKPTPGKRKTMKGDFKNPYFYKVQELCKKHNTELVLYQSPLYNSDLEYSDFPKQHTFVNHYNLVSEDCFYDNIHVNQRGRKVCSEAFAVAWKKHYGND